MQKKVLTGLVLALSIIFTFSVCFAADDNTSMVNGIRNVMGGAENAMRDAAKGVGTAAKNVENAVRDGAGAIGNTIHNTASDAGEAVQNSANKAGNSIQNGMNNVEDGMNGNEDNNNNDNANNNNNNNEDNNGDYTATRTSADNTIMGMNSTAWTWLILGVAAIAIIALVWYYSAQLNTNRHDDE